MKNRDYFLPSVTTLILFGLVWFMSCAHQNRSNERAEENFSGFADVVDESEEFKGEFAATDAGGEKEEFSKSEEELSEKSAFDSESDEPASFGQQAENQKDEFAFATEKPSQAPEEATQTDDSVFADDSASSESSDIENEKSQEQALAPIPESGEEQSASSSDAFSPEMAGSAVEETETQVKPVWVARTPKVPQSSFLKKGARLNRFYFVRKGDSSKKLSQLFFGDASHDKKLRLWNGARWLPGSMVFYASPQDPHDTRMVSYYQENQVAPEEYKVRRGDSLSSIARKKLGHVRSWKEIAVVNGIESPNALEAGQLLALYPRDLSRPGNPVIAQVEQPAEPAFTPPPKQPLPVVQEPEPLQPMEAQAPAQPQETPSFQQPAPQPLVAEAPRQDPAPQPRFQEPEAPIKEQAETEVANPSSEINWDQLVEQNFVAILIGAALIILLLALSARKKRKKSAASPDEDSSSEPKSRFGRR